MSDRLWGFFHHISQRIIRAAVTEATRPGQPALSRMYSAAGGGGGRIGVNSMTERSSPPEELISQECDGQAIIATGTLFSSLGLLAGCREEYKHDTSTTSTTYFAAFFRGGEPLTTEAFFEAQIAPENCSSVIKRRPSSPPLLTCLFSLPPPTRFLPSLQNEERKKEEERILLSSVEEEFKL